MYVGGHRTTSITTCDHHERWLGRRMQGAIRNSRSKVKGLIKSTKGEEKGCVKEKRKVRKKSLESVFELSQQPQSVRTRFGQKVTEAFECVWVPVLLPIGGNGSWEWRHAVVGAMGHFMFMLAARTHNFMIKIHVRYTNPE